MYSTVQYSTIQYSTVQYWIVQYSTVQYNIVQYSPVLECTVQYYRSATLPLSLRDQTVILPLTLLQTPSSFIFTKQFHKLYGNCFKYAFCNQTLKILLHMHLYVFPFWNIFFVHKMVKIWYDYAPWVKTIDFLKNAGQKKLTVEKPVYARSSKQNFLPRLHLDPVMAALVVFISFNNFCLFDNNQIFILFSWQFCVKKSPLPAHTLPEISQFRLGNFHHIN